MLLSSLTIESLKAISGLRFDRASDFDSFAKLIYDKTGCSIGVTTLKRLFGYIDDPRDTNKSTLNILARYLGFDSWKTYECSIRIDSEWNIPTESIWVAELELGQAITIRYLDRIVRFEVESCEGERLSG